MKVAPDKVILDASNFLRLDGVASCKIIEEDGHIFLEFFDRDRMRSSCRGDHLISIELDVLVTRISELIKEHKPPLVK